MNVSPQQLPKQPPIPEHTPHERISHVFFVESVPFAGERSSVSIGMSCDTIAPARLEPDGSAVIIDKGQRADGLLLRRKVQNLSSHERFVDQVFVPWSNVKSIGYGA